MSLFAAGVAILALLFASYSRRSTWVALCSMAMSMAALIGFLFLSTTQNPSQIRTRVAWIADKLPLVLNGQIPDDLVTAVAHVISPSSCGGGQRPGCTKSVTDEQHRAEESPPAEPETMQAAATTGWLETKPDPQTTPVPETKQNAKPSAQSPVIWRFGDGNAQASSSSTEGFSIGGTNVSDQALEDVHAVLKPDSSQREVDLVLGVEGHKLGDGTVIPAGARFSLVSETPNGGAAKQFDGAILTFRYVQAGQRKTSILYLTPSMVSRFANRG